MPKSTGTKKKVISKKPKVSVKKVRQGVSAVKAKIPVVKKSKVSKSGVNVSENQILMAAILLLLITGCSLLAFPLL